MQAIRNRSNMSKGLPANITADDVYHMMMLHKYQRKTVDQIARQFKITRSEAYNVLAKRQVGGCCG